MFTLSLDVADEHLEPEYRHVNHARSLTFLEDARLAFLRSIGFPNEGFIERNLFFVIASIHVTYKRELLAGPITVTCEEGKVDGKSVLLRQKILNGKGKVVLEAVVESKFMDGMTKRAIQPPAEFAARFGGGNS